MAAPNGASANSVTLHWAWTLCELVKSPNASKAKRHSAHILSYAFRQKVCCVFPAPCPLHAIIHRLLAGGFICTPHTTADGDLSWCRQCTRPFLYRSDPIHHDQKSSSANEQLKLPLIIFFNYSTVLREDLEGWDQMQTYSVVIKTDWNAPININHWLFTSFGSNRCMF